MGTTFWIVQFFVPIRYDMLLSCVGPNKLINLYIMSYLYCCVCVCVCVCNYKLF